MTSFYRGTAAAVIFAVVLAVLLAGCGGGGGGGSTPSDKYVFTGNVSGYAGSNYSGAITNATVTIAGKTTKTDANGNFRLEFTTPPTTSNWSVDGSSATPSPGFYTYWAKMGIVTTTFNAVALPMPSISEKNITMPTVYLWWANSPPPPN